MDGLFVSERRQKNSVSEAVEIRNDFIFTTKKGRFTTERSDIDCFSSIIRLAICACTRYESKGAKAKIMEKKYEDCYL